MKDPLTPGQGEPLLRLINFQNHEGSEVVFLCRGGWDVQVFPWNRRSEIDASPIIEVPKEIIEAWCDRNLVIMSERRGGPASLSVSYPTFLLSQESLDYGKRMSRHPIIRWVLNVTDGWEMDLRAALIGGLVSLLVTLLTLAASGWFGLNQ